MSLLGDLLRRGATIREKGVQVQIDVGLAQAFLPVTDSVGAGSRRTHELALDLVENAVNESTAVFRGLANVYKKAGKTDARQNNKNLIGFN